MNNLNINNKNRTIEMTKQFAKEASRFGSDAYKQLQDARRDYPNYRIITRKTKRVDKYLGLTFNFMENYIRSHDDEEGTVLAEFYDLRGISEEAKAMGAPPLSYGEIKSWFLEQYPEFAEFQEKREKLLNKVA